MTVIHLSKSEMRRKIRPYLGMLLLACIFYYSCGAGVLAFLFYGHVQRFWIVLIAFGIPLPIVIVGAIAYVRFVIRRLTAFRIVLEEDTLTIRG
jgi:hypothetical protein